METIALRGLVAAEGCAAALHRCAAIVTGVSTEVYARDSGHGTIGAHVRHCLDHFECFWRGLEYGEVDYDARDRDTELERRPALARERIAAAIEWMAELTPDDMGRPLVVRQTGAPGTVGPEASSSVERELLFLSGHTIHHVAIMILIAERLGAPVPRELGVAYSTASHRASQRAH